jgi:DNA-directed RNA polymerase specialized sigma24 family protein
VEIVDPAAFCDRVSGRLVGSLTLYCGDRHLAEELAQEALARAWERWPAVSHMASPEAWTFRTAMNLANSGFRRRRIERRVLARAVGRETVDPDDGTALAVRAAVRALPPRQRAVIVARWFLGYGVDDGVADQTGAPDPWPTLQLTAPDDSFVVFHREVRAPG